MNSIQSQYRKPNNLDKERWRLIGSGLCCRTDRRGPLHGSIGGIASLAFNRRTKPPGYSPTLQPWSPTQLCRYWWYDRLGAISSIRSTWHSTRYPIGFRLFAALFPLDDHFWVCISVSGGLDYAVLWEGRSESYGIILRLPGKSPSLSIQATLYRLVSFGGEFTIVVWSTFYMLTWSGRLCQAVGIMERIMLAFGLKTLPTCWRLVWALASSEIFSSWLIYSTRCDFNPDYRFTPDIWHCSSLFIPYSHSLNPVFLLPNWIKEC